MADRTIVILNDYCHINGGASRIAIDEAVSLAAAGEKVIFFGACGPVCPELQNAPLETICLNQPELIEAGKNPAVLLQGIWNLSAYRRMIALLSTLDPARTVIHLHGYTKALTTSPVRAAVKRDFKVVCTLHDFFPACPNGAFFDYVKNTPCPKRGLSMSCIGTNCDKRRYHHKLYRVVRSAVQRTAGLLPSGIMDYITLSRHSVELLRPYLPANARLYPLENLIETVKSAPVDVAANRTVVAVGRLDVEKGIEVLLEAAKRTGTQLTLVGDGPLRALAETYPNCRVTGWLPPKEVFAELAKARCLAFPSLWYETYGLVVTEAAARGIPAIVSAISAASERVNDGMEGWHVRAGDVDHLAKRLELAKDDANIRRMGQAAYERFWNKPPTRDYHTKGLLAIYKRILDSREKVQA
ncbi:MAG TPA: glycosyltransferase [Rickettsiales bacterium]|nr:glycosyltransferase [Rickettsiales bacterium]